ncbi:MAG: TolC family protein [Ginsengibacter sp.]
MALANCKAYTQTADTVLSLRQSVDIAIKNNLQVKQSDLQAQSDYISLKQSKANKLPDANAFVSHGLNQGRSIDPFSNSYINQNVTFANYALSSSVIISNGGQLRNLVKQNEFGVAASRMDVQLAKENLTLDIILAYLQVLNNEDLAEQSKNQMALTNKQVERLEILNKEGAIIPAQLFELRGQMANDQLAFINNQNAAELSKLTLSQLMNVPYSKNLQLERFTADQYVVAPEANPEMIYSTAEKIYPRLKAAEFRKQSATAGIRAAKGQFYPQISLNGNINSNFSNAARKDILLNQSQVPSGDFITINGDNIPVITTKSNFNSQKINYTDQVRNNYGTSLSLDIRIPILNANMAKNRVAQAKIALQNSMYVEETAKIQLRQSIEQAYFNMNAANEKYKTLQQQVADFEGAFKIAEVRFNEGVSNQVEYLIAKNNYDRSRINLISALYDYIFRIKILDYYQGKLVL